MKTRITALFLAAVLLTGSASAAFSREKTYTAGQFTDVAADAWYATSVKDCYELGLMSGNSAVTFNPSGVFTVAETLTVTARMHNLANGGSGVIPSASGAWYQGAVDYCLKNGIISEGEFDGAYSRAATRTEMACLIRAAVPESVLIEKNKVTSLPDVPSDDPHLEDILCLYRAGILGGSDSFGSFKPYASITRAEVAAIAARVALADQRLTLTLAPYTVSRNALPIYTWNYMGCTMSCGRMAFCDNPNEDAESAKWGYLDNLGNVAIPAQYSRAHTFREGRAIVCDRNDRYGVIDTSGRAIIPIEYNYITWVTFEENEQKENAWKNGAYVASRENYSALYRADGNKLVENTGSISYLGEGIFGLYGNEKTGDSARLWIRDQVVTIPGMKKIPDSKLEGKDVFIYKYAHENDTVVAVSNGKANVFEHAVKYAQKSPLVVMREGDQYYVWNMDTNRRVIDVGASGGDSNNISLIGEWGEYEGADLAVIKTVPNGYDPVTYLVNSNGLLGKYDSDSEGYTATAREYAKSVSTTRQFDNAYKNAQYKGVNPDGTRWIVSTSENTAPDQYTNSYSRDGTSTIKVEVEGKTVFTHRYGGTMGSWALTVGARPTVYRMPDGSCHIYAEPSEDWVTSSTIENGREWYTVPGANYNSYAGNKRFAECLNNGERFETKVETKWRTEQKNGATYQNLYRVTSYTDRLRHIHVGDTNLAADKTIDGVTIESAPETKEELLKSIDVSAYKDVRYLGEDCYMGRIDANWYLLRS